MDSRNLSGYDDSAWEIVDSSSFSSLHLSSLCSFFHFWLFSHVFLRYFFHFHIAQSKNESKQSLMELNVTSGEFIVLRELVKVKILEFLLLLACFSDAVWPAFYSWMACFDDSENC